MRDRGRHARPGLAAPAAAVVVFLTLAVAPGAVASARNASVDQRTRTIAYLVKKCGRAAAVALQASTRRHDGRGRELVSLARGGCAADERRLLALASDGLDFVPEDALAGLDDWQRGLGFLSDYAARGKPATLAKARQSLASGTAWSIRVLEEIDQVRLRHGFPRLQ